MIEVNKFKALKIGLASPDKIREWSYGEVKKAETINYRTLRPERDGLFCERIFGPTKDFECACGKYKRLRYKNVICDRCGVEVTRSKVRRERMGHIELACPVAHIWYSKGIPPRMGLVLEMSPRDLEEVIYFVSYVVLDKGTAPLEKKQILSDKEYRSYVEKYGNSFRVGMGAEAIKELLTSIDLEKEINDIKKELETSQGQKKMRLVKRLEILDSFSQSKNRPEWMIIEALPVIPPDLRPMIQLDGGRFAASDLNDLYRRVINRNNRLKKLIELTAPSIIIQNEKRMLQEAVDALFDNGKRGRNVTGAGNRALKSLSGMLKGKQGRFRQNLLGKRVDYSGRSVIVVGPELKMYQCGIPKNMALELFKPHIIKALVEKDIAHNIKAAKNIIEYQDERVWDIVEEVICEHPVLLNRAPTLHRLGIQAFEPKLVSGKAIKLHPLVCTAFNADFDGDQMAVHVPLSDEAQAEARILMLGANNILHPKDGTPVVTPGQDMVLGNYYLTMEKAGLPDEGRLFKNSNEALMAYARKEITLHTRICIPTNSFKYKIFAEKDKDKYLVTTVGKLIFNEILPDSFPYLNEATAENISKITPSKFFLEYGTDLKKAVSEMPISKPFGKKNIGSIIAQIFKVYKTTETSIMLDRLKNLGFKYSTIAGITFAASDIIASKNKGKLIDEGTEVVNAINKQFQRGLITNDERYRNVIEIWNGVTDKVIDELRVYANSNVENPLFIMMNSEARGSMSQFRQLAGMRGIMAKPNGQNVEIPITSSFIEGLTVSEFFLSTHGARKGLADTALRTADSGYLTRRLVEVVQDMIVREDDCGTILGITVSEISENNSVIETLKERIVGRFTNQKVVDPKTKEIIVGKNEIITENIADKIVAAGIKSVEIRSILTCKTEGGVCSKCYGRNLATGNVVETGEAIGVMAAQSIGEPGTQLTMRTFHTGGVAGASDITQGLPRVTELFEARNPKGKATIAEIGGKITKIEESSGKYKIYITNDVETKEHVTTYASKLKVKENDVIAAGDKLTEGAINPKELLEATDPITVQEYILKEIQNAYRSQGVDIADKHIETITRRMMSRIKITDEGDTEFFPGAVLSLKQFTDGNNDVLFQGKKPAIGKPILLGITKASLETDSFLSAASFQETTRILTDAAIKGKVDHLKGLQESVIIGKLIPAGKGSQKYTCPEITLEKSMLNFEKTIEEETEESKEIDE